MAGTCLVQRAFAGGGATVWPDERLGIAIVVAFVIIWFATMSLTRRGN